MFSGLQFEGGSHTQRDGRSLRYKEFSSPKHPKKVMSPSKNQLTVAKNIRGKKNILTASKKLTPRASLKQSTAKPISIYEKKPGKSNRIAIVDIDHVKVTDSLIQSTRAKQENDRKPTGDSPPLLYQSVSRNHLGYQNIIVDNSSIFQSIIQRDNNMKSPTSPRDSLPFEGSFNLTQKMSLMESVMDPSTKLGVLPSGYSISQDMMDQTLCNTRNPQLSNTMMTQGKAADGPAHGVTLVPSTCSLLQTLGLPLDEKIELKQQKIRDIDDKINHLNAQLSDRVNAMHFMDPVALFEQKEEQIRKVQNNMAAIDAQIKKQKEMIIQAGGDLQTLQRNPSAHS